MRKTRKSVSTKKEISQCKTLKEKQEDFIMLPTVDFCFKELMQSKCKIIRRIVLPQKISHNNQ